MPELQTIAEIEEILANERFDQLLGLAENEILEAKREPWDFGKLEDQQEFAKDVSALANARGGVILIGASSREDLFRRQDVIREIRWLPESLNPNSERYAHSLSQWVYPVPVGFSVSWHLNPSDKRRGIIALHIPDQNSDQKPFLVAQSLNQAGTKKVGWLFGYFVRRGAEAAPATVQQLQNYIRNGMGWDPIVQKLDAILARIEDQ